jgi:1,4-dihydroxy-2-naphthoyl-CoA hydrolase
MTDPPEATIDVQGLMPFAKVCGIRVLTAAPPEVRGEMDWAPELCTIAGVMHGGALISFADTVGATCAAFNLPAGASTTTVESKTNFFRALRGGRAHAVAVPLHVGRTFIVVQTDVRDDENRRIVLVTQTQAVLTFPQ